MEKQQYKRCNRCIMDNKSDVSIRFDENGNCNYCNDVLKRMPKEYFPNEEGEKQLESIFSKIKEDCKDNKYDCLVGVSGGIDSSFILYLGHKYGLRMLAIHIDDGLDNPIAVKNIQKLIEATGTELVNVSPDRKEYADLLYSLFKASVSNLAFAQDNLIIKALQDYADENKIKYLLDGLNFAHECILERGESINACDGKFIRAIQKQFGTVALEKTTFTSLTERYLWRHTKGRVKHVRPLNYLDYNLTKAIRTLEEFCGFEYYGGKHYESILTRFMQCYYLPEKFGIDKRKSHYSSLIMSGQMTRDEALKELEKPLYPMKEMLEDDKKFLADYMGISVEELNRCISLPPVPEKAYKHSFLNELAPIARKIRKFIE